jgi:hypothetical protein
MTAAETIEKAIEKLEGLATSPGPWIGWRQYNPLYGFRYGIEDGDGHHVAAFESDVDTALVETLHRTINTQLVILRAGVPDRTEAFSEAGQAYHAAATILAEAILGED